MSEQNPIIEIKDLHKSYGTNEVLSGVNLSVMPGQIIGYIGPNGAGKSTTVKILIGLDNQFDGSVMVNGIDVKSDPLAVKKRIGYIPEIADLYDVLTPIEYLRLIGKLHSLDEDILDKKISEFLDLFGLAGQADQRMDTFSKGMKQKVLISSGLLHDPDIIFMDEPLTGLDANTVILIKEIISQLAQQGKTIFYCSHMMDIVEKVSDRIVLINNGNIIADGSFEELSNAGSESLERIFSALTGSEGLESVAADFVDKLKGVRDE